MVSRREVLAGGVVGSFTGRAADHSEEQEATQEGQREIQRAVHDVRQSLDTAFNTLSLATAPSIAALRRNFEGFLRANTKFPDFCEIGIGVFYDVYDWHIRTRQQVVVRRQQDNRYTIQFMLTTLILRYEHEATFIGVPYDKA
jgi:hypothetical protein